MRHIVGETRVATKREAKVAARAPVAEVAKPAAVAVVEPKKAMKVNDRAIEAARMMGHKIARKRGRGGEPVNPLTPYQPPPGVLPKGVKPLAMDEALATVDGGFGGLMNWGGGIDTMFEEGIGFLGYSYLAQLTQRPEFRRMSERIGTEMTRKWIKLQVVAEVADPEEPAPIADGEAPDTDPLADEGEGPEAAAATAAEKANEEKDRVRTAVAAKKAAEKAERVKELEDAMRHFRIKDHFANIAEGDGWFGRYHLYVDLESSRALGKKPLSELVGTNEGRAELQTSIGNGSNETSRSKVRKGSIKAFRPVEPMWCYPATYEAANPLKENFYNPDTWYANGITIHRSRLLCFVGREVPDILKPAYAFGGLSLSQMAKPYVDNWLRTRQAVADLIESFSVSGVYTNMQGVLQDGGIEALKRIELFNVTRSNAGAMMLDKDTEEFFNVSTPLGTLDALQAQSQEQMSSVSGIPLVILLGITPQGLNASSEGEIRAFYDWIHAYQETFFRDHLQTVIHFIMLHLWGEIDEEITFEFEPLWSMTDKEATEIEKLEAETDQIRIDSGVLDPAEVRKALAAQPESRYADINPEDVPEPPEQPSMGGEDPFGGDGGDGGADPSSPSSEKGPADRPVGQDRELALDGEWNEDDHPRADDGKFGSGSGSGSNGSSKPASSASKSSTKSSSAAPLKIASLKKQGGKLGSNEGGVYTDDAGSKFYVKKPATKAHVTNEKTAAKLYQLAGVNTLDYREAGPDHVVTAWQDLEKNNIAKFTVAEKKEAAKDFAVHAWLSNWDAAGTGGDNQGILNGKPHTLDVGGSLRYRAQGGPKGAAFGNKVTELDTMRNASMSPDAARLFGSMSDDDIKSSIERVTSISDEKIREAVGDDKELADTLIARKQDMAKRFGVSMAQDEAMFLEALMAHDAEHDDSAIMEAALASDDDDGSELEVDDQDDDEEPTEVAPDVFAMDEGKFDESKHKRDSDGKFSSTGGGGGGKVDDGKSDILENLVLPGSKFDPSKKAPEFKTKKEHIAHLLTNGVTPKELMQTMGWPSVSMPAQAKSLGMKLEKKDGKYFGTKMTPEELAAAKAEAKGKETDKQAQQILKNAGLDKPSTGGGLADLAGQPAPKLNEKPKDALAEFMSGEGGTYPKFLGAMAEALQKGDNDTAGNLLKYNPAFAEQLAANMKPAMKEQMKSMGLLPEKPAAKPAAPAATADELKKAAKSTSISLNLVPGDKPMIAGSPQSKMAADLLKQFNDKYAGKELTDKDALNQKVQDFKQMTAEINSFGQQENAKKAEIEKEAKAAQIKAAKEAADKAAAEQKAEKQKLAEQHKEVAKELGIKDEAELEAFDAFVDHFGGTKAALTKFKAWQKEAEGEAKSHPGHGFEKLSGFEMGCIKAYTGPQSGWINEAIRDDIASPAQYMFEKVLNSALDKLPKKTGVVKRGLTMDAGTLAKLKPGKVWTHRNFASTNHEGWGGNVKLVISASGKGGAYVAPISSHTHENETLFKSNLRLFIDKVEDKGGVRHIHCREL